MIRLKAKIRKEIGKRKVKKLRKEGKLPAILYGPEIENLTLELDKKEFEKNFSKIKNEPFLLEVKEKEYLVEIKEIQRDPLSEELLHVDFYCLEKRQ